MILRNRMNAKAPQAIMSIGMLCLILALVRPRFLHLATNLGPDWTDGLRGLLFGLSIGLNLVSVSLSARQRRSARR